MSSISDYYGSLRLKFENTLQRDAYLYEFVRGVGIVAG